MLGLSSFSIDDGLRFNFPTLNFCLVFAFYAFYTRDKLYHSRVPRLQVRTVWSGNEIHQLSGEASIATTLPRHDGKQLFTIHRSSTRCSCFCVCPLASISHPWVRTKFSTPLNSLHHISLIPCITTFSSHLQLEDCIWYNFTAFHLAYRILSSAVLP